MPSSEHAIYQHTIASRNWPLRRTHSRNLPKSTSTKPSQFQAKPQISKPNPDADIVDLGSDSDSPEEQGEEPSTYENDPIPSQNQSQTELRGRRRRVKPPKFKLVLRSGLTSRDITLNVRSATKCGAIVKAFLKKAGLEEKYPALMVHGGEKSWRKSLASSATASNKIPQLSIG
ncbi:hypothetical protein BT96DRAFT_209293 [Gymnopus androsaceus JB14]|uniref:Uncharacterized protein n=1 Tax=Gymnopus androsaceus JB14 TaxID=1447944 RepID=A0A6A4H6L6_9AGAR|nr:hypothetical protein BT96DRAFT_209293 [Gymnopus androsaceus JB14]